MRLVYARLHPDLFTNYLQAQVRQFAFYFSLIVSFELINVNIY
jgi:hypothetical protein